MRQMTRAWSTRRSNLTKKRSSRLISCCSGSPELRQGIEIARRFGIKNEVIDFARENLDISAQEAENYLKKLQTESKLAEDLRIALEDEREAVATKFATLDMEAIKTEKQRKKEFEQEMAQALDEFDRQSKAFLQTIEDKALKNRLDKERMTRKAELNRAVMTKVGDSRSEPGT